MKRTDSAFKDELLFGLKAVRESILNEALALPAEARDRVFLGTWSVMDLLAHLAGWDFTNLQAVPDPAAATGWKTEIGPFPGWAEVPEWQP